MSMQRAIINCEKCFSFKEGIKGKDNLKFALKAFEARNEAMRALEHAKEQDNLDYNRNIIEHALSECLNCTYYKKSIKEYFEQNKLK